MMILQAEIYDNNTTTYTKSLYQHDKNVTLVFDGIDLPGEYEVHFANEKDAWGVSFACKGNADGVMIPDGLLSTGKYVYAWVVDSGETSGKATVYEIVIPVIPRPVPIPVEGSSDGSGNGRLQYSVDEENENLTFLNAMMNGAIQPNIEEET